MGFVLSARVGGERFAEAGGLRKWNDYISINKHRNELDDTGTVYGNPERAKAKAEKLTH